MDELKRLRERAGIVENGEGFGGGDFASASAAIQNHSNTSWKADLMNKLSQIGGPFADAMMETGKVSANMNSDELWTRLARAFLMSAKG